MAKEQAERGRSHAAACRRFLVRLAADRRRRPGGPDFKPSEFFSDGLFLDFRTGRKGISDGLPVWPAEAYFIRRWPSLGDVLVAYREDLEPLALDGSKAAVKDESVNRNALTAARRDLVDKALSALGRGGENYNSAEDALLGWRAEHLPEGLSDAEELAAPDAGTRVACEAVILRNVLCYFRDPRWFMEEAAFRRMAPDLEYLHRFGESLEGIVGTWGPAAFLNTTVWAAVVKASPLRVHSIMARVNSAGPAREGHRPKGSKDKVATSLRKQTTVDRMKALRGIEVLLHDPSGPDSQAARAELLRQGMRVLLEEIDKRVRRLDKRPAEREAKTLLAELGNEKSIKRATITRSKHRARSSD